MSLINSIRLYNADSGNSISGPGTIEQLAEVCAPMIKSIKEGKLITHSGLTMLDELYQELVKRDEIKPISTITEFDKKKYWLAAKKTGEQDRHKLIQIARSIYLCEKI